MAVALSQCGQVKGRCLVVGAASSSSPAVRVPPFSPRTLLLALCQGLEGCEPVVLIVDDSSAVWPNDRRNLFIVERYIYFPSSRRRLGMAGKSLLEVDRCAGRTLVLIYRMYYVGASAHAGVRALVGCGILGWECCCTHVLVACARDGWAREST